VEVGDIVMLKASDKMVERFKNLLDQNKDEKRAEWLQLDPTQFKATIKKMPERSDVQMPIQEQLIVELYSK